MALIKRKAKIFEAGLYPDRGGEYTVEELDKWCENHKNRNIPLSIGHLETDGPENPLIKIGEFGMGFFTNLVRIGKELFADLFIDEAVNDLVERSGARGLSVGIDRDAGVIVEGSWVKHPRIASAAMFNNTNVAFQFAGEIAEPEAPQNTPQEGLILSTIPKGDLGAPPEPPAPPTNPQVESKFAAEIEAQKARADAADKRSDQLEADAAELRKKLEFAEDSKVFDSLVAKGKILPAHAKSLIAFSGISTPVKITFADSDEPKEMTAVAAIAKFFENYDPKLVCEAQLPTLKEEKPTASAHFSADDEKKVRAQGERNGLTGEALDEYVANAKRFVEANI